MFTLGYNFKPWTNNKSIADGPDIRAYIREAAAENGVDKKVRYGIKVTRADWSTADARWTLEAERSDNGEKLQFTAGFVLSCTGYYNYAQGYEPAFPGRENFRGQVIHPQKWPEDLDYRGKKVVVIGSGATAVTLVPAMTDKAAHVTMLQRSPTYFFPGRNADDLADQLRELEVDEKWIHEIVRRRILKDGANFTRRAFEEPEAVKQELLAGVSAFVGPDAVEQHFTPRYKPWRQRIAFVPDGDLFQAVRKGKASIVTDHIERFTEKGLRLASGQELEADVIITATGFNMNVLGDIDFSIDGQPLDFAKTVTYRGMMFTGVPNLVWVFGYFRASWTLRVDIVADFVCRLLNHMRERGANAVEVALRPEDRDMPLLDWIDPENFNPNYLLRALPLLPKRGDKPEWQHTQDYWTEKDVLPAIDLDGPEFVYDTAAEAEKAA
jgi:cation diffusion facilitator CzcD-associated flavoprotein CzcO